MPTNVGAVQPEGWRLIELADALSHRLSFAIVDVRGHEASDHIPRSKVIALADLATEVKSYDKAAPILVVSEHGRRSAAAAAKLVGMGFTAVYGLAGGVEKWRARGMPLESDDDDAFELGGED
jgi:rhodanese-related sulfurtransferase